jgi:hypothetical protein
VFDISLSETLFFAQQNRPINFPVTKPMNIFEDQYIATLFVFANVVFIIGEMIGIVNVIKVIVVNAVTSSVILEIILLHKY